MVRRPARFLSSPVRFLGHIFRFTASNKCVGDAESWHNAVSVGAGYGCIGCCGYDDGGDDGDLCCVFFDWVRSGSVWGW